MLYNTMRVLSHHSTGMQVIYMDTEGFEASGKSDAYDYRVFALSTFISALLIYNLPETVRESDIEKLSFAVELAQAFFADMKARNSAPAFHSWHRVYMLTSECHQTREKAQSLHWLAHRGMAGHLWNPATCCGSSSATSWRANRSRRW